MSNDKIEEFEWAVQQAENKPYIPMHADVCEITLPIKVLLRWVTDIPTECDELTGKPLGFTEGFVMEPIDSNRIIYRPEHHKLKSLYSVLIEKQSDEK